jgi:predicted outer membrane repeat protein
MTKFSPSRKLLLFALFLLMATLGKATHYYVDSSATAGANNGLTWANAFTQLQPALNFANAGDTLWVANGHYYPGPSGSNLSYFEPENGEVILGGFEGLSGAQETSASQRNFVANRTILSGDLDKNGAHSAADAYHVIWLVSHDTTVVWDGLTIEYGNAIGPGVHTLGAAVLAYLGSSKFLNCTFQNNFSIERGAGIYAIGHVILEGCLFRNNVSQTVGAALSQSNSTHVMRLYNCSFVENTATNQGGAVYCESNLGQIYNCTFKNNTSPAFGAGIMNISSTLQVRNCIFWANNGPEISGTAGIVNRCIVDGGYGPGTNILNVDPQFLDVYGRIGSCSPAVDVGDSLLAITKDLDNNPRPYDGDGNGTAKWDLGAFEASAPRIFPAPNAIVGPNPACARSFDNLYRVTTDNTPTNSYVWTLASGGTISGTNANDSIRVNWGPTLGSYLLTVREVNNASGCFTTNSTSVSLNAPPSVTVTPAPRDSICIGDSLLVTAAGAAVSQQWYFNGSLITGATGTTIQASQAGNYNAMMVGANGCADSAVTALKLYLRPLPVVTFTTSVPVPICQGATVTITGSPGASHQWYRNGGLLSGATNNAYTTGLAGIYNMHQTDIHGCRDSAATGLNLVVNPLPVVTVTPSSIDTICIGDSLALTASAPNAVSYQWFRSGNAISSSNVNPYQAKLTGFYNCRLTDANGCTDSASLGHNLISNDFVNPVALCRNVTVHLNGAGTASLIPAMLDNGSTDDCRIASYGLSASTMTCAQLGANNIVLTVTDMAGRTSTCTSVVTVMDTIRPTATCNAATVYLAANGQLILNPAVVGGASSDNCAITLATVSPSNFVCADTGVHAITYTAQDASGNLSTCFTTITLEDSTRPDALCRTATIFLDGGGNAAITAASVDDASTDNCGIAAMSVSRTNFTCADVPGVFVTLTMSDVSGNVNSCQAFVRVIDSVAPVPVCRDTVIYINFSGVANLTPSNLDDGSTDNCVLDSMWISQSLFSCADTGANSVTLSLIDADTNLSTCISIVTILDTIAPQAVCSDTTFYLNLAGIATVNPAIFGVNSFDNCTYFDTSYVDTATFTCAQTGVHVIELFVVDVNGRVDSCTGNVTILDSLRPNALCNNIAPILSPGGTVTITAAQVDNGSTDNCGIATVGISQSAFTCADVGPNNVVLTVTDVFGNVGTCTAVVTVTDTVSPVATCQGVTTYLDGSGAATVTAAQVNNGSTDNCGVDTVTLSPTAFNCGQVGSNAVTLTVTDTYGNATTCAATVTVIDSIHPVPACSASTRYLDGSGQFTLTPAMVDNGGTDNCGIASYALSQTNFTCAQTGANSVTLTYTDPSGLVRSCVTTVTILDTIDPAAVCANGSFYLNAAGSLTIAVADVASGSTDNCSIASSSLSQTTFSCADIGANSVTATFTDPSGNVSNCIAVVTVIDSVDPTVVCLNPTLVLNAGGTATLAVVDVDGGASDACGIETFALSQTAFACADLGSNLVTFTVTDSSGNSGSCTATVTVIDTIDPAITCTTATAYLDGSGNYALLGSLLSTGSTDVCGIDTSYTVPDLFTCAHIGVNTVAVYVADPSGNLDSCTTTFTLLDNLAPVADCDSVTLQLQANGTATLTPALLGPNSADNCGIDSSSVSQSSFTCANTGWIAVTLVLIDSSGNQSSCVGYAMVVDTTGISAPNVSLGPDTTACNGDTLAFDAGAGMSSYLWSTGDTTQGISVSAAGTYWVQVVSQLGCAGSDSVVVSSFATPNPDLRSESGNLVVCLNDTLRLLVDPIFSSYQWSTGDTGPFTDITTGGNYSVIVEDANGCTLLETIAVQFAPFPGPNPSIQPSGTIGMCENTTISLDAGPGYYAYLWNTAQTTQVITAFVPGIYNVQVWNGFGCHGTSPDVTVVTVPSPYPDINRNGDTLYTTTIGTTYQWYIGSAPILGANSAQYVASINGVYTVRVYYASGCDEISAPLSFAVGMPDELTTLEAIEVYPNPSDGRLQLRTGSPIRKSLTLRVTDLFGRSVYAEGLKHLYQAHDLDLSDLAAGVYLLEIRGTDYAIVRRLVIE